MNYRTKTYIAADWDNDRNIVELLERWNCSENLRLHFSNAHDLQHSSDYSLPCSIKNSLCQRMDVSKTFV